MEGRTALEIEAAEALMLLSLGGIVHEAQEQMNTDQSPPRDVNNSALSSAPEPAQPQPPSNDRTRTPINSQASAVPPAAINQTALQAYLIHQQRLAGIAPDKIVMMDELSNSQQQAGRRQNRGPTPGIVQITNDGIVIPHIPPAQFNGTVPEAPAVVAQSAAALQTSLDSQPQSAGRGNVAHRGDRSLRSRQRLGLRRTQNRPSTHQVPRDLQAPESSRNALMTTLQPGQQNVPLVPSSATSLVSRLTPSSQSRTTHGMDSVTVNNEFNVFNAIMRHPELAFVLAKHLDIGDLISLYAISRDFHDLMNTRFHAMVMAQALTKAPESAQLFPFRCYQKLCIEDPARNPHPDPERAKSGECRYVPSLRWVQMLLYRDKIVMDIIRLLQQEAINLPRNCIIPIKKLWFLMDIPDNARRLGVIQNPTLWSDEELFFAGLFMVKLDMRFMDPLTGGGRDATRQMVLAQPTMTTLWKLLGPACLKTELEGLKAYVLWKHVPTPDQVGHRMFGVPPDEIGRVQYENYGKTGRKVLLQRPDELVIKEGIRRQLKLHLRYNDMLLWGYVKPRWNDHLEEILNQPDDFEGEDEPTPSNNLTPA
ncbi:hypothetical protein Plec18167_004827 [Paecilomyces lecythidis]|uniref:F-box domain-containing protein n=1 Tax=Paecilomyces lecythidis TaxID=3004212 RepID=A0ABR3XMC1_9EURO